MTKYKINNILFESKKDIKKKVESILQKNNGKKLLKKDDFDFMINLLSEGHPKSYDKIGCGVEGIFINFSDRRKISFFVKRIDKTETSFDYEKCINNLNNFNMN
jgi:hypothetical protein